MDNSLVWKKILVGVDDSEYAERALKQAIVCNKRCYNSPISVLIVK